MNAIYIAMTIALVGHFVFDFLLQTEWMATNKSKSHLALGAHVGVYTIGMILTGFMLFGVTGTAFLFGLLNGAIHYVVDFLTSRATTKCWQAKNYRRFFKVIGLDQLIHGLTLVWTIQHWFSL